MAYWRLTLLDEVKRSIDSHDLPMNNTHHMIWLEGKENDVSTWTFVELDDDTQPRRMWLGQIVVEGACLSLEVELDEVYIKQALPDTSFTGTCQHKLVFSTDDKHHIYSLRKGDIIDFKDQQATIVVDYYYEPTEAKIEVASSRPDQLIKTEPVDGEDDDEGETTDEDDLDVPPVPGESQLIYSTSREHLSPAPKPSNVQSQVVQETPTKKAASFSAVSLPITANNKALNSASIFNSPMVMENGSPEESSRPQTVDETQQVMEAAPIPSSPPQPLLVAEADVFSEAGPLPDTLVVAYPRATSDATPGLAIDETHGEMHDDIPDETLNGRHVEMPDIVVEDPLLPMDDPAEEVPTIEDPSASIDATAAEIDQTQPPKRGRKRKVQDTTLSSVKRNKIVGVYEDEADEDIATVSAVSSHKPIETPRRHSPRVMLSQTRDTPDRQQGGYVGDSPRILFSSESSLPKLKNTMKFLANHKAKATDDVKTANFLCMKDTAELKSTAKILHSLLTDKHIVTEEWVTESVKANRLLDPKGFLPSALILGDRSEILAEHVVYVTPKLRIDYKKGWDDMHSILLEAGAKNVISKPANQIKASNGITLFLGSESDDLNASELQQKGHQLHKKDVIATSIIRARLLLGEPEFLLNVGEKTKEATPVPGKTKKGKKK